MSIFQLLAAFSDSNLGKVHIIGLLKEHNLLRLVLDLKIFLAASKNLEQNEWWKVNTDYHEWYFMLTIKTIKEQHHGLY